MLCSTCGITGLEIGPSGDLAILSIDQRISLFSVESGGLTFKSAMLSLVADASDFSIVPESGKIVTVGHGIEIKNI